MSLDLGVRGDPAGCRDTAARLARLGAVLGAAADDLARRSHLSEEDFGGLSGDAFRTHAATLAGTADDAHRRCVRLGRALGELAADLDDVRRLMDLARTMAPPWLPVRGDTVLPPTGVTDRHVVEAWRAWCRVREVVEQARAVERRSQHDWRTALQEYADASRRRWYTPPEPYDPALGPHTRPHGDTPDEPEPQPEPAPGREPGQPGAPGEPVTVASAPGATAAPATPGHSGVPGVYGSADAGSAPPHATLGFGLVGHETTQHAAPWSPPPSDEAPAGCGTPSVTEALDAPR